MRLTKMFELQRALQEKLGTWKKILSFFSPSEREKARQRFINQMILAMHEEVVEIMKETAYKNPDYVEFGWKKGQVLDKKKVLSEVVDLWHFMMNVCLAYDFTAEDFYQEYCRKNGINHERQKKGY